MMDEVLWVIDDRWCMDAVCWIASGTEPTVSESAFLAGAFVSWERHVLKQQSVRVSVLSKGFFSWEILSS